MDSDCRTRPHGGNMARRLARKGAQIALFNRSVDVTQNLAEETGHLACDSLQALSMRSPRAHRVADAACR